MFDEDGGGGRASVEEVGGGGLVVAEAGLLYFGGSGFFGAGSEAGVVLLNPLILLAVQPSRSSMLSLCLVSSIIGTSCISSSWVFRSSSVRSVFFFI